MTETAFTGVLKDIADVAGEPAAALIAAHAGGTRIYIPEKVNDTHWLVSCVGRAAAEKICKHFATSHGGVEVDIPLAVGGTYASMRRAVARKLHELDQQGKSSRDQARGAGVTQRTVHRHRAAHRPGQGKLL